jgi:hypothetical protein
MYSTPQLCAHERWLQFDDTLSYEGLSDTLEHADARGQQALQVRKSFANHFVGNGDLEWQYGKI